jgi:hypothetical protein
MPLKAACNKLSRVASGDAKTDPILLTVLRHTSGIAHIDASSESANKIQLTLPLAHSQ